MTLFLCLLRYKTKADLTDVHGKSKEFLEFGAKIKKENWVAKSTTSTYWEANVGYVTKA